MEFKDRFRELRTRSDFSVIEIARRLNKSESAIRMWETGKSKPDADTLLILGGEFDCSVDYLLGLTDYKNNEDIKNSGEMFDILDKCTDSFPSDIKYEFLEIFAGLTLAYDDLQSDKQLQKQYLEAVQAFSFFSSAATLIRSIDGSQNPAGKENFLNTTESKRRWYELYTDSKKASIEKNSELWQCADKKNYASIFRP
ncbi:helix-turn-helix domain-containing protein [Tyzzerella sp. OttesenSCG-928-J15]|nr:helix-turn-helix domain-containing protein [Tyzzerella sp. OttesenSCG-928-J15]